jgi:hypothetical protein
LLLLLAATGCASGASAPPQDAVQIQESARVVTPGSGTSSIVQTRTTSEDFVRTSSVPGAPDRLWPALAGVFDELKLRVTLRNDASRQLGSQGQRVRGAIGGTRLSLMFSCGAAAGGGQAADSYELTIDVTSQVMSGPTAQESSLRSFATAVARPMSTSGEPVRCMSTGRLEEKIAAAATKRLVGS